MITESLSLIIKTKALAVQEFKTIVGIVNSTGTYKTGNQLSKTDLLRLTLGRA
jgi:hypothetical protein